MTYSLSGPYTELALHIHDAQASGLPSLLTRLTDPLTIEANRNRACPRSLPRPDGLTCDEYPFASTYQGAYFTSGAARTFPYCGVVLLEQSTGPDGYSICMILGDQNSGGGSALNSFYRSNRVLDSDYFRVTVTT